MIRLERLEWDGRGAAETAARLRAMAPPLEGVSAAVGEILARVRDGGDGALRELGARFGEVVPDPLRLDPAELARATERLEPSLREALEVAARNVEAVARAEAEVFAPVGRDLPEGQRVEVRAEPVATAGIYAPRGQAGYPSSILMCAIPARVAGVRRVVAASPAGPEGSPADAVLAACGLAGVDELYAIGGAQAIAALAYGTESVPRVEVVAGPGSRYVTEAKRMLSGLVGIDGLAGPSELAVIADRSAPASWIALDVRAQAEHGADGLLAVISPDPDLLDRVAAAVRKAAPGASGAGAALGLVVAPDLDAALALADALAPEHLELAFDGADREIAGARVAGCVFVGPGGATAFGDYAAGSNHVLPTGGAARFGGPLGPQAFMRRTSVVSLPEVAAQALAPHVAALSEAEGYPLHGESAKARAEGR